MREIVFDTETTGFDPGDVDRTRRSCEREPQIKRDADA